MLAHLRQPWQSVHHSDCEQASDVAGDRNSAMGRFPARRRRCPPGGILEGAEGAPLIE